MKDVKVAWKLVAILLLGGIGIVAVGIFGLVTLRDSLLAERRATARQQVELGARILARFHDRESAGEMTGAEARHYATAILTAASAGTPAYFWIMDRNARFIMHPAQPQMVGRTLAEVGDPRLADSYAHFVDVMTHKDSGFVTYLSLKPGAEGFFEKISYFATFRPWDWKIGAGVYVDDIQHTFARLAWIMGGVGGVAFALVLLGSVLVARSITIPLSQVAAGLRRLSAGDLDVPVPAVGRTDELGDVARAMGAFQDSLRERERLLRELEESNRVLQENETRYRALTELSPVGVFQMDARGGCTYVNARWCEFAGLTADQALGAGWTAAVHPDDRDRIVEEWNHVVEAGEVSTWEFRLQAPDGRVTWVYAQVTAVTDGEGCLAGYVGTVTDTTRHRQTQEVLRRSQHMETMAQLTGGIAHDFNNLLGIILAQAELLRLFIADDPRGIGSVDALVKAVNRGADLTRRLLSFSRTHAQEIRQVSVNEFIQGMEGLIAKSLTPAIHVETVLADDAWPVAIDPGDFEDALLNMAINARDAMPDGGTLIVETANRVLDEDYAARNPGGSAGEFLMIAVSDTGVGMAPEVRDQAFEPFFTTKEEGKGTGLGLSMVYGFVQRSGGHAKIYSEQGMGTTIRLYLPRMQGSEKPVAEAEAGSADLVGGEETILIVDDEPTLVDSAAAFLEGLGYRTLTASTADEALSVLRAEPAVDLLFSDVIMPGGRDGYDLAVAARDARPGIKILLTSGFTRRREEHAVGNRQIATDLARTLLHKPYTMADLARAVRRTLDGED